MQHWQRRLIMALISGFAVKSARSTIGLGNSLLAKFIPQARALAKLPFA
jgi:hypothetical protein